MFTMAKTQATSERGERERPALVDYLLVAAREKLELSLRLRLGALELGQLGLEDGRVVHAQMPGASGNLALELLARVPGTRVEPGPAVDEAANVNRDWREVFAGALKARSSGRTARRGRVYAELRGLGLLDEDDERDPGASMSMTTLSVTEHALELSAATLELLGRAALEAYLRGDLDQAQALFSRCVHLSPESRCCRTNLERVRLRILDEESLRGTVGGAE